MSTDNITVELSESQMHYLFSYGEKVDHEFMQSKFYHGPYGVLGNGYLEWVDFVEFIKSEYRIEINDPGSHIQGKETDITYLLLKL